MTAVADERTSGAVAAGVAGEIDCATTGAALMVPESPRDSRPRFDR